MFEHLELILVPTDFSPASAGALRVAIHLAKTFNAGIELFHVDVDPSIEGLSPENAFPIRFIFESVHADSRKRLERMADEVRHAGVPSKSVSEFGRSSRAIVEQARASHAGLIVIGRHQAHHLGHSWLGGVAGKVVEHAPCAVLVVPFQPTEPT